MDSLKRLNVAAVKNFDYGKALNKYVLREYKKKYFKSSINGWKKYSSSKF